MHPSGLLILTSHISSLCKGDTVSRILRNVRKLVKSTLYIHLNNVYGPERRLSLNEIFASPDVRQRNAGLTFNADVLPFVTKFYSEASLHCRDLDVNVLLHNIGTGEVLKPHPIKTPIDCILVDLPDLQTTQCSGTVREFVASNYVFSYLPKKEHNESPVTIPPILSILDFELSHDKTPKDGFHTISKNDAVVIGGTFDHLHSGHKVLLSEAILLASRKIVIGLSDGPLLERKTLKELIQPISIRCNLLEKFLTSVSREGLELHIEAIQDPYGPSITVPDLDAILVSKETEKGGHMVNERRKERELSQLKVHIIGQGTLLDDFESDSAGIPLHENKASSSSTRFRLLGTLLKPSKEYSPDFISNGRQCYIIGLTGGIAAGKSSIAERLENLGAVVIDCDKLGHKSYIPGSRAFNAIVEHFGEDVISADDRSIDRRKLGEKVFSDKNQLAALNGIVWPEIENLCKEEIANHMQNFEADETTPVFVLDAAILLEAEWDKFVHEVWVVNVPHQEAVKRITERNNILEENAVKRINSQSSNEWRTSRANVVLSTLWEPEVTQRMVEKAWSLLQQRMNNASLHGMARGKGKAHKL